MVTQKHDDPIGGIPIAPAGRRPETDRSVTPGDTRPQQTGRKATRRSKPSSPRRQWLAVLLPCLVLALGLGLFFLVPYLLTDSMPHYLGNRLHRPVTIGEAEFSLLPLRVTLRHGIIGPRQDDPADTADPLLSFSELSMELTPKALLHGEIMVRKLTADRPFFHFVLQKNGSSNLSTLLAGLDGRLQPQSISGIFSRLLQLATATDIDIDDGRLLIDDKMTGKQHQIEKIVVMLPAGAVPAGGNGQDSLAGGRPEISAVVNGNPVSLVGRQTVTAEGPALDLRLEMHDTELLPYAPYIPSAYGYRILAGRGDLLLDCFFPRQGNSNRSVQLAATLKLSNLRLQDAESTEIPIGSIGLSARYLPASRQLVVKSLDLEQPSLPVIRQADGSWSFPGEQLLRELRQDKAGKLDWRIEELSIRHGTALFTDLAVNGGFAESLEQIALSLHGLHPSDPKAAVSFSLQAKTRRESTLTLEGKLLFSPFSANGMLLVDRLPLPALTPYLAEILGPANLLKGGDVEKATTAFSFTASDKGPTAFTLREATLRVSNLSISSNSNSYRVPSVIIDDASLDSTARQLTVGRLEVADLTAELAEKDLSRLVASPQAASDSSGESDQDHWQTMVREASLEQVTVRAGAGQADGRLFSFGRTQLVNLDSSSDQGGTVTGQLFFAGKSTLQFTGQLSLTPFRAELQIVLDELPLPAFPEFWADWLNIPVQTGMLQAKGDLRLPDFSFNGSFGINDFKAGADTPAIAWHQLLAESCQLKGRPFSTSIKSVTLERPYLQWIIREQQSPLDNLKKIGHERDAAPHSLRIDYITIDRGSLDFADHAISPPYLTRCEQINGTIDSLSNTASSRCHLSVHGMLPGDASLSLDGDFGLFDSPIYADFRSNISDLNISPLSPYTEPILGYTLSDGLLDMRTTFHQERGNLTANNDLTIHGLKLGRQLQNLSQLPLTIALLADPDGTIKFSVPIRGDTADSSFSYSGSFLDTLQNLLLRTAVSPFSVLNALIPERNALDLDHITFGFGEAKLSEKASEQLAEIAKAIKLRPWLAIGIEGQADGKTDLETLTVRQKQRQMEQQLQRENQLSNRLSSQYGNEVIDLGDLKDNGKQDATSSELPSPGEEELVALAKERAHGVYRALQKEGVSTRQLRLFDRVLLVGADSQKRNGNRVSLSLEAKFPL